MEDDLDGHEFGERGGRNQPIGFLGEQDRARVGVDHEGFLGLRLEKLGSGRTGKGCRKEDGKKNFARPKRRFFHENGPNSPTQICAPLPIE